MNYTNCTQIFTPILDPIFTLECWKHGPRIKIRRLAMLVAGYKLPAQNTMDSVQ